MNTRLTKIHQSNGPGELKPTSAQEVGALQLEQLDLNRLSNQFVRHAYNECIVAASRLDSEIASRLERFIKVGSSLGCSVTLTPSSLQTLAGLEDPQTKTNREALLTKTRYEQIEQLAMTSLCPVLDDCMQRAATLIEQSRDGKEEVARLVQKCKELEDITQEAKRHADKLEDALRFISPEMVIQRHQAKKGFQQASQKYAERASKLTEKQSVLAKATQKFDVLTPQLKEQYEILATKVHAALSDFTDQVNKTPLPELVIPERLTEILVRAAAEDREAEAKAALEATRQKLHQLVLVEPPLELGCREVFYGVTSLRPSDLKQFFEWFVGLVEKRGWEQTLKEEDDIRLFFGPRVVDYCMSWTGATEITKFLKNLERLGLLQLSKEAGPDCQREMRICARALRNHLDRNEAPLDPEYREKSLNILKTCVLLYAIGDLMPLFLEITGGHRVGLFTAYRLHSKGKPTARGALDLNRPARPIKDRPGRWRIADKVTFEEHVQ